MAFAIVLTTLVIYLSGSKVWFSSSSDNAIQDRNYDKKLYDNNTAFRTYGLFDFSGFEQNNFLYWFWLLSVQFLRFLEVLGKSRNPRWRIQDGHHWQSCNF